MKKIAEIAKDYKMIVILTSHEKELALKYVDRTYEVTKSKEGSRKLEEYQQKKEPKDDFVQ